MKTSLSHLPQHKQQQILQITEVIKEVVQPEKIILFGSYATGTWVEDQYIENGIRYSYISDYDFLVVTKNINEKEFLLTDKIVNQSRHLTNVAVNCIVHDIEYVNEGLSIGQYFFTDIVKEGIELFDSGKTEFKSSKLLTPAEQKEVAQNYFNIWFNRGSQFLENANYNLLKIYLNLSAFNLHQSTECFYNTVLLVCTGYKPKTHSLDKLRQYAKPYSKELMEIFPAPTEDKREANLFDLLKRGYIDARYKNDYNITEEELTALIEKVKQMQAVVEKICIEKMDSFNT